MTPLKINVLAVNHTSRHDVTIVMGDLNASIGSDRIAHRGIIGPLCSGFGSRLLDLFVHLMISVYEAPGSRASVSTN